MAANALKPSTWPDHLPKAGYYRHYKGQYYQVLYCARHSETEEWLVVYQCLYGDFGIWVRPAQMFAESVTLSCGKSVARFNYTDDLPPD